MARTPRRIAGIGAADITNATAFDAYVGPAREITADPARGILALHDGATAGGKRFLNTPVITPQLFGAKGDGVTNDTAAWAAFQVAAGANVIPAGSYLVNGAARVYARDVYGDGGFVTALTAGQQSSVGTRPANIKSDHAKIALSASHTGATFYPAVHVAVTIKDDSGAAYATKVAGIYSYIEQTGGNTNQYPKSICGVAVNAASGNNDSTAVVGYSYKLNVAGGIGDACGSGGAAWQYSTEEGLVLGAEFAAHQNVAGTSASPNATAGNNTMSLHITTNSTGARCWSAIGIDGQDAATAGANRYGYWNAIAIGRSCFAANGASEAGTVGINFGNNTTTYPERALYLGNAVHHLWRSTSSAIRSHCASFDIENTGGTSGLRLVTPSASPQDRYIAGYKGSVGPDGTTSIVAQGAVTFQSDGYAALTAHDSAGAVKSKVQCSPATDSFLPASPSGSGNMSLGSGSRLWSQVYASTATISTSDERAKTAPENIPDAALDAWGEIGFGQFRFLDAVAAKGGAARLHTGVIAQRVIEAFAAHGLDAATYGLLCHDTWEAEPETVRVDRVLVKHAVYEQVLLREAVLDDEGREVRAAVYVDGEVIEPEEYEDITTVTPGAPGGDRYGIRYEEALCFEAAYQRRRAARAEARLEAIEMRLAALEAV